jgi:hypothetical protein
MRLENGVFGWESGLWQHRRRNSCKRTSRRNCLDLHINEFLFYQDSLPFAEGKMHCLNLYFECAVKGEILLNEESCDYACIGPSELKRYEIAFRHDLGLIRYWQEIINA